MQIAPGIFGVDFHGRVWSYLVAARDNLTLIDTGIAGDLEPLEAGLREAGAGLPDVHQTILTHCHKDHAGLLAELKRLTSTTTIAHSLDAPVIRGHAKVADPDLTDPERAIFGQMGATIPDAPPATIDREVTDADEIEIAGHLARVIHLPGHTPGSIGLFIPPVRTLFTGDAVAALGERPFLGFFNIQRAAAARSFARLAEIDFEIACFGHGPPLLKDAAYAFRRTVERLANA
jgi:glyoxylase-like metal-dependent hydrolase (beta-lactamase superfamily II)